MEKDHLEILLEDMNGKFDLVLEGHEGLRHDIRELARKTDERFDLVDLKFGALNSKIDGVEAKLDQKIDTIEVNLNRKIDTVESNLNKRIDTVAADLNQKIDTVAADLNQKMDTVAADLGGKIDTVAAELNDHRSNTEAHHGVYRVKEEQE